LEIRISGDELKTRKLFLGLPCYGGACAALFARSIADLAAMCQHYGVGLQMYFLMNESLITRARNYIMDEFDRSPSTHMMFIDSDIGFNPNDVLAMLAMMSDDSPYDILGAPYPKKCISWEKIKRAVDKGMADENPNNLDKYVGDFVFNPKANQTQIAISEPAEVLETGTGFMMMKKKTLEMYKKAYPEKYYKPDHVRTEAFDGSREIMMYFNAEIDPKTKRYLSEDYLFCQQINAVGGRIWLCPWMQLSHVGTFVFGGSLADLASIGASATANPDELKHKKKMEEPKPIALKPVEPEPIKENPGAKLLEWQPKDESKV